MRYLVESKSLPFPPEMAKAVVEMSKASESWYEGEMKAGRLVEAGVKTDGSGGIMLWEMESNDALFKKLVEHPFWPFIRYTVTPLTDMKIAAKVLRQRTEMALKAMAGK